jgi:predicted dehydrogenase/threonine dehydrogenase-like Zn-dependent dehydrogenase
MKQVLQSLKTGATEVADVPAPGGARGQVLIRSTRTLVSAGTEGMLVQFGQASLIGKARSQPDKVKQVLEKMKTDGVQATLAAVSNKLDQPLALGYCNVGTVLEVGRDVNGFEVGDRVVSNGKHAEIVRVPKNLCAKVPDGVSDDEAAFAVIGAIGLQGLRLAEPTLGEAFVVTGLGLIGLVTVQLLRAHGCRVLGIDFDKRKLDLARQFGASVVDLSAGEDPVLAAEAFSRSRGVDGVIITASTRSSEPVHQAATMCRKRGRIVLVGVTGLELSRADFYEKELSFQVSCSYGPGRYDTNYEEKGFDYPVGFVRWTEQRNFEAVLDMAADGRLNLAPLVSHRFAIDDAESAYALLSGGEPSLGILLEYPSAAERPDAAVRDRSVAIPRQDGAVASAQTAPSIGFIGSGNYATATLIPAFKAAGARLRTVASSGGVSGLHAGRKFGFESTTTDTSAVLADPQVNAVVISTRHDTHAALVSDAFAAGKNVFVEKPLALTSAELDGVEQSYRAAGGKMLMVGFNRRFSPQVSRMKELLGSVHEPKVVLITVNAGAIPANHWTQDPAVGGGRIIGEGCHFIDLARHLVGAPIEQVEAMSIRKLPGVAVADDKASITLRFQDGSIATIVYTANGHKSFPKERVEVFVAGRVLQLDNFRRLRAFGWPGFQKMNLWKQDKGQKACAAAFVSALANRTGAPIPFDELMEVSRATIAAADQLR